LAEVHYGIDVGGTKTEFAVFDDSWSRVDSHRIDTPTTHYPEFISALQSLVNEADAVYGADCSVGVGLTGIVDRAGNSFSVNVPCLNGNAVQKDLAKAIGRDVRCINDVRAFALSEARGGAADGFGTMVGIILGTGAASGYCRAGIPRIGVDGVAGEWGHIPISAPMVDRYDLPIFDCSCGKSGCMEAYVSGPGLARLGHYFVGPELDSIECVARMRRGDQAATEVFGIWIDCVASVIGQLVLHDNPEAIVIGGGMSNIDELFDRLPEAAAQFMLTDLAPPPILRAKFGDDSGVRGAAMVGGQAP